MQKGGGKRKGSAYEREVCKRLSLWLTDGKREDCFWRSINSGAQFTLYKKSRKSSPVSLKSHSSSRNLNSQFSGHIGDIAAIDPLGEWFINNFAIELKHYEDLQVANLIYNLPSKIREFWIRHVRLCESSNKLPLLIARQNRKPDLLITPRLFAEKFSAPYVLLAHFDCAIFTLNEFIESTPYEVFENTLKAAKAATVDTI